METPGISIEEEEGDYNLVRFDFERPNTPSTPISSSSSSSSRTHDVNPPISMAATKPNCRFLCFLLQTLVMAFVTSLFFLFVGIAALVLLHICIAGRALRRRRRRHLHSPRDPDSPSGLSPKDLQRLPCFDCGDGAASDCAVCLEGHRPGERCRVLPRCKHVFHAACVDRWLVKVPACPVCRSGVVGFGLEGVDSEERVGGVGVWFGKKETAGLIEFSL